MRLTRTNITALLFVQTMGTNVYAADVPPLSFKGIEFGKSTEQDVAEKFKGAKRYASMIIATASHHADATCGSIVDSVRNPAISSCRSEAVGGPLFRIGQTSAGEFMFTDKEGKIEELRATFTTTSYGAVVGALEEKYGKPTSSQNEQIQNKAGASFSSMVTTWKLPDGEIIAAERSGKVDTMSLRMATNKAIAQRAEEAKKSVKEAAQNL
jgi:hypothetical protein